HYLHFSRTEEGTLTDISATGNVHVHLQYEHPLGRLTSVKRIVNKEAVETLARYHYDDNGQLSDVYNRNGDSI
ncbi:Rhs family protein, partial [Pseudomonas syringae pv. actinidiae ICMP 18807]